MREVLSRLTDSPNLPAIIVHAKWTGDPNYSPDHFYTIGGTDHGTQKSVRVAFPFLIWSQMDEIVGQRQTNIYQGVQDLIRDAVVHRLHWLQERINNGEYERLLGVHIQRSRQLTMKEEYEQKWAHITEAREGLQKRVLDQAWGPLAVELRRYEDELEVMTEPWRNELARLIDRYERVLPEEYRGAEE